MSRRVKCPRCSKPTLFTTENPHRPFCSERCKTIDLGAWADQQYAIPVKPSSEAGSQVDHETESYPSDHQIASSGENPNVH